MSSPTPNSMALKLMIVGRRKPGTTLAEHRHHIRHVHGELVLRYIATEPHHAPQRYVQHQVFDGQYRASRPGTDPFALNRDFITEVRVPDFAALARSRETAFYREHLMGDEDHFVDQATVVFMPVREREVSARNTPSASAVKLFNFIQKAPGADALQFATAWSAACDALGALPAAHQVIRHVQNEVQGQPGAALPADGIDEFWLEDEASARALLSQWQACLNDTLVLPGLATDATFALLATESVLHAGPR